MQSDTDDLKSDFGETLTHEFLVPSGTGNSSTFIKECVVPSGTTQPRKPEMTKTTTLMMIGRDKEAKKTSMADLADVSAPLPIDINGTVDFDEAIKMIPPSMEHVEGYICSLADCRSIIAMIKEHGKNIMVRIPATATIVGERKTLRASTARIGHPIRLYQILKGQIEWKKHPTLSAINYYCRLFSVVGEVGPTIPTIAVVADYNPFAKVVSGHVPTGMTTKQPMLSKGRMVPITQGSIGTLLHADAYELSPFTKILKNLDCDIYIKNYEEWNEEIDSRPKLFALTNLRRLESEELLNIEQKCKNLEKPSLDELELWVGRATATLAAYHTFIINKSVAEAKLTTALDYHPAEDFTASWKMETKCVNMEMREKFARGETVDVSFRSDKSQDTYTITANITSVIVDREDTQFVITFSPLDNCFLNQWISDTANKMRAVKISPVSCKEDTHQIILSKFRQLPFTRIGRQFMGRMSSQNNEATISEESRWVGLIRLDDHQTVALSRIVGSRGITTIIAPPGSGKTTLLAAVTREWITNHNCGGVIITGSTNICVGNVVEVIQSSIPSEDIRTLRVASTTASIHATVEEKKTMSFHMARRFEEFITDENQRDELEQLQQYWLRSKRYAEELKSPNKLIRAYNAEKDARIALTNQFETFYHPNVVALTTSILLELFNDRTSENVTKIIIDDASMLRPSDLMAIVCRFPKLESLVLIGDTAQFPPHLPTTENTDLYKCFGQSDINRLHKLCPDNSVKLATVYGAHPDITRQLMAPNYPFDLDVGAMANQHTLAEDLKLPTADSGSPIQFIHINGHEIDGENRDEAKAISRFVEALLARGLAPNDLMILVNHRNQLALMQSLIKNITIKTIDSAQSQRVPVIIIATTKTSGGSEEKIRRAFQFVGNPNRATVAVSRAKQAVYVFGFLSQLEKTDFWRPLIAISRQQGGARNEVASIPRRYAWTAFQPSIRGRND